LQYQQLYISIVVQVLTNPCSTNNCTVPLLYRV